MIEQVLRLGRMQSQARFTETFEFFTSVDGSDPVTLEPTSVETVIASGVPGRLKRVDAIGSDQESGGQFPVVQRLEIHVPVGAVSGTFPGDDVLPGDDVFAGSNASPGVMVRVTGSTVDPSLTSRVFRVSGRPTSGQVTAHRYPVEEVS